MLRNRLGEWELERAGHAADTVNQHYGPTLTDALAPRNVG